MSNFNVGGERFVGGGADTPLPTMKLLWILWIVLKNSIWDHLGGPKKGVFRVLRYYYFYIYCMTIVPKYHN